MIFFGHIFKSLHRLEWKIKIPKRTFLLSRLQLKSTENKDKITLKKIIKFAHQKIKEKKAFLVLTNSKIKIFSKF
jgi:hypothetical protein